ncbi:hypothetical protein BDW02DRAFT_581180 [Decorospora gaudefroyi]|uniref:Uncharacterized protein n=1 Tax=Decorospora gaudefroyi TaxID=184978 RepID=A0A6A5K4A1_9PLEO|nr:hypothetical protein BDW02DRAFT_581180 [Decorospora gaudefroyi]
MFMMNYPRFLGPDSRNIIESLKPHLDQLKDQESIPFSVVTPFYHLSSARGEPNTSFRRSSCSSFLNPTCTGTNQFAGFCTNRENFNRSPEARAAASEWHGTQIGHQFSNLLELHFGASSVSQRGTVGSVAFPVPGPWTLALQACHAYRNEKVASPGSALTTLKQLDGIRKERQSPMATEICKPDLSAGPLLLAARGLQVNLLLHDRDHKSADTKNTKWRIRGSFTPAFTCASPGLADRVHCDNILP